MRRSACCSFRLRTLLVTLTAVCLALGWWLAPYEVSKDVGTGLTAEFTLRRSWNGTSYYVGNLVVYYPNGQIALINRDKPGTKFDQSAGPILFVGRDNITFRHESGIEALDFADWYVHQLHRNHVAMCRLPPDKEDWIDRVYYLHATMRRYRVQEGQWLYPLTYLNRHLAPFDESGLACKVID